MCDVYDSMLKKCTPICPEVLNLDDADSAEVAQLESIKEQCPNVNIPTAAEAASSSDGYRVFASIFIGALAIFVL
jgi:hypothetical protein